MAVLATLAGALLAPARGHGVASIEVRLGLQAPDRATADLVAGGQVVGRISARLLSIRGLGAYDLEVVVDLRRLALAGLGGPSRHLVVVEYEALVDGRPARGYIVEDAALFVFNAAQHLGCDGVCRATLRRLVLTVNVYSADTLVAAGSVNVLRLLGAADGLELLVGLPKLYFWVEKVVVDPFWLEYRIARAGSVLGSVKVLSHGPFDSAYAVRLVYDVEDPELARSVRALAYVECAADDGEASAAWLELEPGADVLLPDEVEALLGLRPRLIRELLVVLSTEYFNVTINVTRDVSAIVFADRPAEVVEVRLEKVRESEVAPGVVEVVYLLGGEPLDLDDAEASYVPDPGTPSPWALLVGVTYDEDAGTYYLRALIAFPEAGRVGGTLVVRERGATPVIERLGRVGPLSVSQPNVTTVRLPVTVSASLVGPGPVEAVGAIVELVRVHGLDRSFEALGRAALIYLDVGGYVLDPYDLLVVRLSLRVKPEEPVRKVWFVPLVRADYVDWAKTSPRTHFLFNGTGPGVYSTYVRASGQVINLTYTVPAQALVRWSLEPAGEHVPRVRLYGLGLLVLNVESFEVLSAEASVVDYAGWGVHEPLPLLAALAAAAGIAAAARANGRIRALAGPAWRWAASRLARVARAGPARRSQR